MEKRTVVSAKMLFTKEIVVDKCGGRAGTSSGNNAERLRNLMSIKNCPGLNMKLIEVSDGKNFKCCLVPTRCSAAGIFFPGQQRSAELESIGTRLKKVFRYNILGKRCFKIDERLM